MACSLIILLWMSENICPETSPYIAIRYFTPLNCSLRTCKKNNLHTVHKLFSTNEDPNTCIQEFTHHANFQYYAVSHEIVTKLKAVEI